MKTSKTTTQHNTPQNAGVWYRANLQQQGRTATQMMMLSCVRMRCNKGKKKNVETVDPDVWKEVAVQKRKDAARRGRVCV